MQKKRQYQHIFDIRFEDALFTHVYRIRMGLIDFFALKDKTQASTFHSSAFLMEMKQNGAVFHSENDTYAVDVRDKKTGLPIHQAHYDNGRLTEYLLYDNNGEITCRESFAEEIPQKNETRLPRIAPAE